MQKNIILVGFMGAGKTSVAQIIAQRLGCKIVSTDDLIVQQEQRPITDIFRDSGEAYFRKVEGEVVARVAQQDNLVIDCGGGVVLNPANVENLKQKGTIFYLHTSAEEVYKRTKDQTHRPLLNTENPPAKIRYLLKKREPFYMQADVIVETDGRTPYDVGGEIIGKAGS